MSKPCDHVQEPPLPDDIQETCRHLCAKISKALVDNDIVRQVHELKTRCETEGVRIWTSAVRSIPYPARFIVEAIAALPSTTTLPERSVPRVTKFCTRFGISRARFEEFFFGGYSVGFFEKLTKLGDTMKEPDWDTLSRALADQRDQRIAAMDKGQRLRLWLPQDVDKAKLALQGLTDDEIQREMELGKPERGKRQRERSRASEHPSGRESLDSEHHPSPERARSAPASNNKLLATSFLSNNTGKRTRISRELFGDSAVSSPFVSEPELFSFDLDPPLHAPSPLRPLSPLRPPSLLPPVLPFDVVPASNPPTTANPPATANPPVTPDPPGPPGRPSTPGRASPMARGPLLACWDVGLVQQDVEALLAPTGWLTGPTMNMAFEAIACATTPPCFAVSTDVLVPESDPRNVPAYIQRVRESPMSTFLLPLFVTGDHWVLAHISVEDKVAAVYDSLPSAGHEAVARRIVDKFVTHFVGQDMGTWQVTAALSPRQGDRGSCGVFAIVTALHLVFGRPLPTTPYLSTMWRHVIARLVLPPPPDQNDAAIWPFTTAQDKEAQVIKISTTEAALRWEDGVPVEESRSLLVQMQQAHEAAVATALSKTRLALAERERVWAELRAAGKLVAGARAAAAGGSALARVVVDRLGECVDRAVREGEASVAWLRNRIKVFEEQ
ncbi:hypothetical protein QBC39DRAFT_385725 [Podospora conica]|nr:hypothetical protein QBC39DRAFT_385725 [Schizothecium conicum]